MKKLIATVFLSCIPFSVFAADCSDEYAEGYKPVVSAEEYCYNGYAVWYSAEYKGSILSVQKLTSSDLDQAETLERSNDFHGNDTIADGPLPTDYSGSGYDRGHLTPSANMPTEEEQYASFNMTNMVPQTPSMNRGAVLRIENATRRLAKTFGEVYVVTAVDYGTKRLMSGESIPNRVYKAVYVPLRHQCRVYVADNLWEKSTSSIVDYEDYIKTHPAPFKPGLCQ